MRPVLKIPSTAIPLFATETTLRHLLIDAMGAYCVYCESPLSVDIPYAHKVSVSDEAETIPINGQSVSLSVGMSRRLFNSAWVNQQLMCDACAAAKGEKPGMPEAVEYLQTNFPNYFQELAPKLINRQRLDDTQLNALFTAAVVSWVSPDASADEMGEILHGLPGDDTFNFLTYSKFQTTAQRLQQNDLLRLKTIEQNQAWVTANQEMVWVMPNTTVIGQWQTANPTAPNLLTRVLNTIKGLNLNYYNPTLFNASDRRVVNRTRVWDIVNASWSNLDNVIQQLVSANNVEQVLFSPPVSLLVDSIRHTLQTLGFWSLWATVFQANLLNPSGQHWQAIPAYARQLLLYSLLIEYEVDTRSMPSQVKTMKGQAIRNDIIAVRAVLPGTDTDRLTFLD